MSDGLDLAAIRARAEAAATWPSPWKHRPMGTGHYVLGTNPGQSAVATCGWYGAAAHIAGMDPSTTLALVDELEQLRAKIAAVREIVYGERGLTYTQVVAELRDLT